MEIIKDISGIKDRLSNEKKAGHNIGLVPTMGYLHEGHLNLIKKAVENNDVVVVSIFVNPTQFGPEEDYEEYPRDLDRDARLAKKTGVDYIFSPEPDEMYFADHYTFVQVEELTDRLCGAFREGHFRGVATVVSKLFNIIMPDKAYFGQKDFQQFVILKRMVRDLNIPVAMERIPTVREEDGLAVSSRNKYLSERGRETAAVLYKSLKKARSLIKKGENDPEKIKNKIEAMIQKHDLTEIEYIEIVDPETLKSREEIRDKVVIALAVYVEETRLIDNIYLDREEIPHA